MSAIPSDDILYCDTDSIMFIQSISNPTPIETGNFLGDLTDEIPPNVLVNEFYCGGPKFYLLCGQNSDNPEPFIMYKIKGVTLNHGTQSCINAESIKQLVLRERDVIEAPFKCIKRDKKTATLSNFDCQKKSRVTNSKRLFYADGQSYPFGYVDL